jgi:hypothetical protein
MNVKILPSISLLIGLAIAIIFVFHPMIISNFRLMPGDVGDERLIMYILNHWYNVFIGHDSFFRLNFLYPDNKVLGYSDALFLFGIIYSFFRMLGYDYFVSVQLLYFFIITFGYCSAFFLFRRILRLNLFFSVAGAIFFVTLNCILNQFGHGQLLGFYFYPLLVSLIYLYLEAKALNFIRISWLYLIVFFVFLGLFFFTSYYPAWFFVFSLLLFIFVYFVLQSFSGNFKNTMSQCLGFIKLNFIQLFVGILIFIVSLIPFLINYLPIIFSGNKFSFAETLYYSPSFKDIINVGGNNYIWSPVLSSFHFNYGNMEYSSGFPILFLIVLLVLMLSHFRFISNLSKREQIVFSLAIVAVMIFFLIVKFNDHFSMWYFIYYSIPGAKALRALGRYLIVAQMLSVVFVVYYLNNIYVTIQTCKNSYILRSVILSLSLIIMIGLIIEQANKGYFNLDKYEQRQFLSKFQSNNQCDVFYLNKIEQLTKPQSAYQTDALLLSMQLKMPTLNGYSGIMPKEWHLMNPSSPLYNYYVYKWIKINNIKDRLCSLNLDSGVLTPVNVSNLQKAGFDPFVSLFDRINFAIYNYLKKGYPIDNLYPITLVRLGFLDNSFDCYPENALNNWTRDGYWIGKWDSSYAIGYAPIDAEVATYLYNVYKDKASKIFFPFPAVYDPKISSDSSKSGQILIVFNGIE